MIYKPWADMTRDEKIETLIQSCIERISFGVVAQRHDCTRNQAIGLAHRAGVTWHTNSPFSKYRVTVRTFNPKFKRPPRKKPKPRMDCRPLPKEKPFDNALDIGLYVDFLDRSPKQCAWIVNADPQNAVCCGAAVDPNHWQAYCGHHAIIGTNYRRRAA